MEAAFLSQRPNVVLPVQPGISTARDQPQVDLPMCKIHQCGSLPQASKTPDVLKREAHLNTVHAHVGHHGATRTGQWAGEMAQQVEHLPQGPGGLSSIPRTHTKVGRQKGLMGSSHWPVGD